MLGLPRLKINNLKLTSQFKVGRKLQQILLLPSRELQHAKLPDYKFYTILIEILLAARVTKGANIEASLMHIKKSLVKDLRESRKLEEIIKTAYVQQIFLSFYVVVFSVVAHHMLGVSNQNLGVICSLMFFSVILFALLLRKLKQKKFSFYDKYFKSIYIFKTFLSVSLPLNQVVEKAKIHKLPNQKKNSHIKDSLLAMAEQIKKHGRLKNEDVDLLIEELWNSFLFELENFKKTCLNLKLIMLCIFALPAFLLTVLQLIDQLSL